MCFFLLKIWRWSDKATKYENRRQSCFSFLPNFIEEGGADNGDGQMKWVLQNRFQFGINKALKANGNCIQGNPSYLEPYNEIFPSQQKVLEFINHSRNTSYIFTFISDNQMIHHEFVIARLNSTFRGCCPAWVTSPLNDTKYTFSEGLWHPLRHWPLTHLYVCYWLKKEGVKLNFDHPKMSGAVT